MPESLLEVSNIMLWLLFSIFKYVLSLEFHFEQFES